MSTPYTYLRLSVTDRCNFNCFYCRPALKQRFLKKEDILSTDEILELVRLFAGRGIQHVRLTGGEPLLRPGLIELAQELARVNGIQILSLTTNGSKLAGMLAGLHRSGIQRVNISMDTLQKKRFALLSGSAGFEKVKEAIELACQGAFQKVKLNVVVAKGVNDDEVVDFIRFGEKNRADVRFIECFPTMGCDGSRDLYVPTRDTKKKIEAEFGALKFLGPDALCGPAQYFRVPGASCRIGFISSVSDFFCATCNRLRLSASGALYPCLHSDHCADLKGALRRGDRAALETLIADILCDKKLFNKAVCRRTPEMSAVGG